MPQKRPYKTPKGLLKAFEMPVKAGALTPVKAALCGGPRSEPSYKALEGSHFRPPAELRKPMKK